jgi:hypothetical protein
MPRATRLEIFGRDAWFDRPPACPIRPLSSAECQATRQTKPHQHRVTTATSQNGDAPRGQRVGAGVSDVTRVENLHKCAFRAESGSRVSLCTAYMSQRYTARKSEPICALWQVGGWAGSILPFPSPMPGHPPAQAAQHRVTTTTSSGDTQPRASGPLGIQPRLVGPLASHPAPASAPRGRAPKNTEGSSRPAARRRAPLSASARETFWSPFVG